MRDADDPFRLDDDDEAPAGERLDASEHFFACPCCGSHVSVVVDLSVESQELIEDCEVCCRPLEIAYTVEDGEVTEFSAVSSQE